jgi:hypothetical protein
MLVIVLVLSITPTALASSDVRVTLDGQQIVFDVPPQIIDDRTMVPLRAIFEALGAEVDWNPATRTVTATRGDTVVVMQVGNATITVDNANVVLDVPPMIVGDRTLVPARAVAESFGVDVEWNGATRTVILTTEPYDTPAIEHSDSEEYGVEWARKRADQIASNLRLVDDWVVGEIRKDTWQYADSGDFNTTFSVSASFLEYRVRIDVQYTGRIYAVHYDDLFSVLNEQSGIDIEVQLFSPLQLSAMNPVR